MNIHAVIRVIIIIKSSQPSSRSIHPIIGGEAFIHPIIQSSIHSSIHSFLQFACAACGVQRASALGGNELNERVTVRGLAFFHLFVCMCVCVCVCMCVRAQCECNASVVQRASQCISMYFRSITGIGVVILYRMGGVCRLLPPLFFPPGGHRFVFGRFSFDCFSATNFCCWL